MGHRCLGRAGRQRRCTGRRLRLGIAAARQPEDRDHAHQLIGLVAQAGGGAGHFLDQGGVFLRGLVDVGDGLGHLGDAAVLLGAGVADVRDELGDLADFLHGLFHGFPGKRSLLVAGVDFGHAVADELLDFLGGLGAAARQGAHFLGHHGKAPAMLARPGRFHGGVEGEDIGLEGNAVDDADDVGNLLAAGVYALHGLHDLAHGLAAFGDDALGLARDAVGRLRVVRVVGHGGA